MKNHKTKNFLIIGTVFCALGTVLFASGIAAGGREYIKNTDLNTYNGTFSSEKSDSNHAILEKEKIDSFQNLNADLKHMDFSIRESDDENYYLSYNVETVKGVIPVSWQVENGTLNMSEKNGKTASGYLQIDIGFLQEFLTDGHVSDDTDMLENQIIVYIPHKQTLENFSCQMNKGDFTLDSLNCQNFHLQTNTGDISLRSLQTKRGAISDKDGDISIIDSSLENMKLDASLGDLSAAESNFTDSILSLSSGDAELSNVSFNNNCQITSKMGDIDLSVPEKYLNALVFSLDTNMGDIDIPDGLKEKIVSVDDKSTYKKETSDSQNHLTVKSDYGDISIRHS